MTNLNVRQAMFPYGMEKNPDGSWTFFNRKYKTLGTITDGWSEWNDPLHKMFITGLGPSTLAKLDCHGLGTSDRIYFYNDGSNPEISSANMDAYLKKLRILIGLQVKDR
ncbi:hypothetical protein [Granulicella mallensis]|uniref:Uncharacterized protein n=1 Tax=Granulicella mallensis (strain ATCC BAA-1857 / DSM 23137 / MP5ACTX8) TaxID=682795 RepID=G8NR72_GRAMM|nr:hypothetical protein [Granulicella mallensis]AEU36150.1 hypothetical protein AciX8_1813 [Granulicella mallensis MP5ACTX8]